jgi:hypothetical protein
MFRPLKSTFPRRQPKRRAVSRSFRIPLEVDRMLEVEARKKGWSKSFLIRDVLVSWATYRKAEGKVKNVVDAEEELE